MKYIAFFLTLIIPLFCSMAAQPEDLTEEDAGQLLFRRRDNAVFVFKKQVQAPNGTIYWECSPFKENGTVRLAPAYCTLLEYLESDLTPEIVEMEFFYNISSLKYTDKVKAAVYINIARKINSPVISNIFSFLSELKKDTQELSKEIDTYRKERYEDRKIRDEDRRRAIRTRLQQSGGAFQNPVARRNIPIKGSKMTSRFAHQSHGGYTSQNNLQNCRQAVDNDEGDDELALDGFKNVFDQVRTPEIMRNALANNRDKNFFKVFCMYFIYRQNVTNMLRLLPYKMGKELYKEITKLEADLLLKFQQNLRNTKMREEKYRSVCRDMHGQWEYAAPVDYKSLRIRLDSCYKAWHRMFNHSAHTEFPAWGNAVLEVLQMMGNDELHNRFDAAFLKYQEQNNY